MLLLQKEAHSWRNNSSLDDMGPRCEPSSHPFGLCKTRAAAFGYPCEDHMVTTEDGYILSLKRIPHGVSKTENTTRIPVLLFHGLMVDSVSWVLGTPKQSLGFILADGGFDVWFANTRGTNSSRNHTSLTPDDPVFISSLVKNTFFLGFSLTKYRLILSGVLELDVGPTCCL
uniref:Partial AB-hydrolase lipase domain-containing protein n=1 Tax=Aegilops tauschii subsp. strangulata TaxID=200361 RepID=A0A453SHU0_AEGTS